MDLKLENFESLPDAAKKLAKSNGIGPDDTKLLPVGERKTLHVALMTVSGSETAKASKLPDGGFLIHGEDRNRQFLAKQRNIIADFVAAHIDSPVTTDSAATPMLADTPVVFDTLGDPK